MELLNEQLKNFARNKFAWPGGYPMFALCRDGGILSHEAVKENYRLIRQAMRDGGDPQWAVIGVDVNWEDTGLYCDHTGEQIGSAYGDDDR